MKQNYLKQRFVVIALFFLIVLGASVPMVLAGDNNINWNDLGHNSRDPLYRYPQGAVPTGTAVTLRLRALDGDLTSAQMRVWNDRIDTSTVYDLTKAVSGVTFVGDATVYEFWEVTLPASALPTVYWYRFIVKDGSSQAFYEDDAARTGGWGTTFANSPDNGYQLTHYDPTFQTPDWIKNAVVYQVFVDRFRDGNSANNLPAGTFFYNENTSVQRSNGTDWNTHVCDPRSAVGSSSTCAGIYSQNFYGGDLQGVIDQLDYIEDLGVTAIYLNPIFESPSNHKYDTTDFMQIDDNFGDLALFQMLSAQAEARGIHIILDGVFNHSSSDSIYFDRYGRHADVGACESLSSPRLAWYPFKAYVGVGTPPCSDNRDYNYWFGIFDSLPVYNHDLPAVREYFLTDGINSVAPYWMQWADGWRLDVAPEIDHGTLNDPSDNYMETLRAAVRAVNPDTYIVGEEWGNSTSWTIDNQWDATMNYQYSSAYLSFFRDEPFADNDHNGGSSAGVLNPLSPTAFNERILNWEERYAPEAYQAMMNLLGSHDTSRALFMLDSNTDTANTALYNNPNYDWSSAIQRLKGVALVQMTMPGAPTIYYGDEVGTVNPPAWDGSQWQDDPYNRVPYPWLDQTGTPYYAHMQSAPQQQALFDYYATLTGARNAHPALRTGELIPLLLDDTNGIYAYLRLMADDSDAALVILNRTDSAQTVSVNLSGYVANGAAWTELLTSAGYSVGANGVITVNNVPATGGAILFPNIGFAGSRPAAVADLSALSASNQVTLDWSNVNGATSYQVWRSRLSHGGYELITTVTDSTFLDTGLTNAIKLWYVIKAVASNGLVSDLSNEIGAIPAVNLGGSGVWYNLQWPYTLNHVLSAVNETDSIYAQIWIDNGTNTGSATAYPGIRAQVGYGPNADAPSLGSWTWFEMAPNPAHDFAGQSNDEYIGKMLPTQTGTFNYTTRWSSDGGVTWFYTDKSGPPYDAADTGVLTVLAGGDSTPPSAPTGLTVTGTTAVSVTLAWDAQPNTDGDLYGFNIYRSDAAPLSAAPVNAFMLIGSVNDAAAVGYVDSTVTTGQVYQYQVTAVDTSLNESAASNIVEAEAVMREVTVTFRVTVPAGTPGTVYIAGNFGAGYPQWDPGAMAMTQIDATTWERQFTLLDGTQVAYKYTRGAWERVEKEADGNTEIGDRQAGADYGANGAQTISNTVANWRDPFVVSTTPANGGSLSAGGVITALWSQSMNEGSVETAAGFVVTGPSGAVSGALAYDDASKTVTFTPAAALAPGAYTVAISGRTDAGGDTQYAPTNFTVGVAAYDLSSNSWYNLQWPHTIDHVLGSGATPTIYGQIWISGVTDASASPVPNLKAQVGYGPAADAPSLGSWTWFDMTPSGGYDFGQNNDEFSGTMTPLSEGSFKYTTRYSADGGVTWFYTDKNSPPYDVGDAGVLTVTAPTDAIAPSAPTNLSVSGTTGVSVSLAWDAHPNTDGDLFSFRVYRRVKDVGSFALVGTVTNAAATSTIDNTITAGTVYEYQITARDASGNESAASNTVEAAPVVQMVAVTFQATVPTNTIGTVYLVGGFGGAGYADWNPGGMAMTQVNPTLWQITLNLPDGYSTEYKYTRGSWDKVEKEADGNAETPNRPLTVTYGGSGTQLLTGTVSNWRDPYVIATTPMDGTSLAYNGDITATWNQSMNSGSVTDAAGFVVTYNGTLVSGFNTNDATPVSGALSYDDATRTVTFNPTDNLVGGLYSVAINGRTDAGGDGQQVAANWTFAVSDAPAIPTAIAPLGVFNAAPTEFSWNKVADATWYYLWIGNNNGAHVLDIWVDAANVCTGAVCSVMPGVTMGGGAYSWFLQSWNIDGGYSLWSGAYGFTVAVPPGLATPIAPTGTITAATPSFSWNAVSDAAWYYLWVSGPEGYVMDQWYATGAICAAGVCSVTPGLNLYAGAYRWWIQAWSTTGGYGNWTNEIPFSVNIPNPTPTQIAPIGTVVGPSVTYSWNRVPGVTWYYIWISNTAGPKLLDQWVSAASACVGNTCSLTPILSYRAVDQYRWWIQSWSAAGGYSPWSVGRLFNVQGSGGRNETDPEVIPALPDAPIGSELPSLIPGDLEQEDTGGAPRETPDSRDLPNGG